MIAPIRNYLLNVEIPNDGLADQQFGDTGEDDDTPFGGAAGGNDDIFGPLFDADRSRQAVEGGQRDSSAVSAPTVTPSSSTAPLSTLAGPENTSSSVEQQSGSSSTRTSSNDLGVGLSGSTSTKSDAGSGSGTGGPEAPATSTTTPSLSHSSSSTPDSQLTTSSSTITASTSPVLGSSSSGGEAVQPPASTDAKAGSGSGESSAAVALTPQQQQAAAKNAVRLQYNLGVLRHMQTIFGNLLCSRLQYYTPRGFWKHFKCASISNR